MMGKAIKLSNCESGGSDYFLLMPMFMIYNRGDFDDLDNLDNLNYMVTIALRIDGKLF